MLAKLVPTTVLFNPQPHVLQASFVGSLSAFFGVVEQHFGLVGQLELVPHHTYLYAQEHLQAHEQLQAAVRPGTTVRCPLCAIYSEILLHSEPPTG